MLSFKIRPSLGQLQFFMITTSSPLSFRDRLHSKKGEYHLVPHLFSHAGALTRVREA